MAVLVFMGLTRGSRGESLMEHAPVFNKSMREWGQRHLSFNNDWVSRFKGRSRSPKSKPKPAKPAPDNAFRKGEHLDAHLQNRLMKFSCVY